MLVAYDTEFLDDGKTIELLSIGMVAENGDELYRIVQDADWARVSANKWMVDNVAAKLPIDRLGPDGVSWSDHPDTGLVVYRSAVARHVEEFLARHGGPDDIELWADYPATDHVALYQLFGPMIECTSHGVPMRTSCLTQEERTLRRLKGHHLGDKPVQDEATKHHALHDARHDMALARWLGLT